jgi:hypothetical protein
VLLGIVGTVSMTKTIKARDAHAKRLIEIEGELDAAGVPSNLPPPQLVPAAI